MKLRIVVADDSTAFLQILVVLLQEEFSVVATAADGKAALQTIREFTPDVAVLDLEMPGLNAIEITRELMKQSERPAVVICSVHRDQVLIDSARKAGVLGYVFKTDSARDLNLAVRTAATGQTFLPQLP